MKGAYTVPFELIKHLIAFPAYVNGEGPLVFWLDTGGPGLIIKESLAEKLGLEITDTGLKGIGAGGEVPILITTVDSLRFAGLEFEKEQATILSLEGMDEKFKHEFHGCIGYHVLKDFEVCIDYVNQKLKLSKLK